ncbi:hypothetical protein OUZ56_016513 [Daphnia magna]|uniref:40S ribosomal protein S7 n=1 Tax=Daphnia magna TaxID=35525 RepID=A0ABR0AQS3_9CRUS|nr:hypothetical protein OUZ56_016513 [Daphnia magna]
MPNGEASLASKASQYSKTSPSSSTSPLSSAGYDLVWQPCLSIPPISFGCSRRGEGLKKVKKSLLDLELNSDLKAQLRELHINAAKEVDVGGKKAVIIFVPVPQLRAFQKIQIRLVRELEKKFSGKHVVFIARPSCESNRSVPSAVL